MSQDDPGTARAPAAGIQEWEPLDVLAFGVPESEALHEVTGDLVAPEGAAARYAEDPIRVPRADGVAHWREWEEGFELTLVCPDRARGWPKRVQALVAVQAAGPEPIRVRLVVGGGDGADTSVGIALPADELWRLVEIDLPERYADRTRLRLKFTNDEGATPFPRSGRRRVSWVQMLGRVLAGTTWSALAVPDEVETPEAI